MGRHTATCTSATAQRHKDEEPLLFGSRPTFARPNDCAMINACPERQVSQHAGQRRRPCDDRSQTFTSLVFRCIHTDAHAGGTARVATCVTRHNGRVASVSTTLKSANIDHTSLQRTTCARQTSRLQCVHHTHTATHPRTVERSSRVVHGRIERAATLVLLLRHLLVAKEHLAEPFRHVPKFIVILAREARQRLLR